jgi:sensor histidine kinase YesM
MNYTFKSKNSWLFNFIFSENFPEKLFRHLALWTSRFLFFCFIIWFNEYFKLSTVQNQTSDMIIVILIHIGLEIFFCYTVIYFLIPIYFYLKKYFLFLLSLFILSTISLSVSFYVIYVFFDLQRFPYEKIFNIFWGDTLNFLTMGPICVCFIFLIVKMLKAHYLENEKKKAILVESASAELQLLKAQVQPHFLFNTLNNIYFFIFSDTEKAKSLIGKLEKLLHYIIHECEKPFVPLSDEINMIQGYLQLEKVRYGSHLDVHVEISGDFDNKIIAPLLMIPFVENSFKHGTSQVLRDPWIRLILQADEHTLHFTVANSKPAHEPKKTPGGIGLKNVQERLKLLYPHNHFLMIEPTVNTFTVNMQIPLKQRNKISEPANAVIYNT